MPVTDPRIQWLGSGLGQSLSTSNCGAFCWAATTPTTEENAITSDTRRIQPRLKGVSILRGMLSRGSRTGRSVEGHRPLAIGHRAFRSRSRIRGQCRRISELDLSALWPMAHGLRPLLARVVAAGVLVCAATVRAHDIPVDVLVQTFLKPEGQTLHLLVRVPLGAMRDVNFPIHGAGFLDFPVSDELLRDAAR